MWKTTKHSNTVTSDLKHNVGILEHSCYWNCYEVLSVLSVLSVEKCSDKQVRQKNELKKLKNWILTLSQACLFFLRKWLNTLISSKQDGKRVHSEPELVRRASPDKFVSVQESVHAHATKSRGKRKSDAWPRSVSIDLLPRWGQGEGHSHQMNIRKTAESGGGWWQIGGKVFQEVKQVVIVQNNRGRCETAYAEGK